MIEVTFAGDVAIARMAHGKANALSIEFCEAMTDRLNVLAASPAAAVVLTGSGHIFSAGVDLPRLLDGGAPYVRDLLPALADMFATTFSFAKPIVAAINGHAIAGGCVLTCACDHRLMARGDGRIGVTELLVGVPFPVIAMEIMRAAAPARILDELILGGHTYPPDEGARRGLLDEVVDSAALLDRAVTKARALAQLSPAAFALTKRQLRAPALARRDSALDAEIMRIWTAPETLGRIRDYVARTFARTHSR